MKNEYIITNEELQERGLNLSDYLLEDTLINAIIHIGLDTAVTRACKLGDVKSSKALEEYLSTDDEERTSEEKVSAFKKVQYRVLYSLVFMGETDPVDEFVDDPLVYELGLKINSIQKGFYYRNN